MLTWFFLALLVFFVALLAYKFIIQKLRVRGVLPIAPDITMQHIWDSWMEHKDELQEEVSRTVDLVQAKFHREDIESIRKELIDLEKESNDAKDPLVPLRRAIMKAVDEKYLSELLLNLDTDDRKKLENRLEFNLKLEVLGFTFLRSNLKTSILRLYSFGKYGDGAKEDWFLFYCEAAKRYAENTVNIFRDAVNEENGSIAALLGKYYEPMMSRLRENLLKIPPKTPVPWSERPAEF